MALSSKLQRTGNASLAFACLGILTHAFAAVQQAGAVVSGEESAEQELGPSPHSLLHQLLQAPVTQNRLRLHFTGPQQKEKSRPEWCRTIELTPGAKVDSSLSLPPLPHRA